MALRTLLMIVLVLATQAPAWGQSASGTRGMNGGVGVLFGLTGPGTLYLDSQGGQGYMYGFNTFESYSFRNTTTGQAWSGGMMTLGPQLGVGLISGGNQSSFSLTTGANQLSGSPTVIPPPPRQPPPLPEIQSSFDEIP